MGQVYIGISGWRYEPWRSVFYPQKLGPFLWQFPPSLQFEPERLERF